MRELSGRSYPCCSHDHALDRVHTQSMGIVLPVLDPALGAGMSQSIKAGSRLATPSSLNTSRCVAARAT
eukprot:15481248-Alexandrium_andersonii.AAC.1